MDATQKQLEVLRWMVAYHDMNGYMPSIREMCTWFNWRSTNAPRNYLIRFQKQGWLTKNYGRARASVLTAAGRKALEETK